MKAFFRVELNAENILMLYGTTESPAVISNRQNIFFFRAFHVERV